MNKPTTLLDYIMTHCTESMNRAESAERFPLWKRLCPEFTDIDFAYLGILRCIDSVDSGRHFLQVSEEIHCQLRPLSTYFNSLKSARRSQMIEALERQSYQIHCEYLASKGIDYLENFPELDNYTVVAADGHFIDHACHTPKGDNGKVYAAGFIYAMNLRNGLLSPLSVVTNGTKRNHEIPILRRNIEQLTSEMAESEKMLYVYDKAVTDFLWWDKQKQNKNYMISVLKENSVATFVSSIFFDNNDTINTGVEEYSIYENNGVKFTLVRYRDPETGKLQCSFLPCLNQ